MESAKQTDQTKRKRQAASHKRTIQHTETERVCQELKLNTPKHTLASSACKLHGPADTHLAVHIIKAPQTHSFSLTSTENKLNVSSLTSSQRQLNIYMSNPTC